MYYLTWILSCLYVLNILSSVLCQQLQSDVCGNENCKSAVLIAVGLESKCASHQDQEICMKSARHLARRLPDALRSTEALDKICQPLCPDGIMRPDNPDCIPPDCEKMPEFGVRQAEQFQPKLAPDGILDPGSGGRKKRMIRGLRRFRIRDRKYRKRKNRKRITTTTTKKPNIFDNAAMLFDNMFAWQDLGGKKCCKTYRRTLPIQWGLPYGPGNIYTAYPVYCPVSGGYQWIDLIRCGQGKCRTQCLKSKTYRTYFVTNVAPHPFWGHCFHFWIPVWFMKVQVETHCYCVAQ